jgi:hypothetical protein
MPIEDEGLRIETPSGSLKKREIKEQDKKMKAAESIEANTCFSDICNDHTALNMDSFEERDLSASYPSAQTSLNTSYVSKSTKSVLFSAVKTTS